MFWVSEYLGNLRYVVLKILLSMYNTQAWTKGMPVVSVKFSDVPKKLREGPQKVGSVGFPETRHFLFLA